MGHAGRSFSQPFSELLSGHPAHGAADGRADKHANHFVEESVPLEGERNFLAGANNSQRPDRPFG